MLKAKRCGVRTQAGEQAGPCSFKSLFNLCLQCLHTAGPLVAHVFVNETHPGTRRNTPVSHCLGQSVAQVYRHQRCKLYIELVGLKRPSGELVKPGESDES